MSVDGTERERWLKAVYLHDALRDAPMTFLTGLVIDQWNSPALLHGPAAAEYAAREGERDQGVLNAVRFHSVGYAGWDAVGRMLYLADYLEPGRKFRNEERQQMAVRVPTEVDRVLREVATERLEWIVRSGWPLFPETVDFWNALPRGS
jgi:HD superfamily phosphohydrolase YqeK